MKSCFFTDLFVLSGCKAEQRQVGSAVPIGTFVSITLFRSARSADPVEQSEAVIVAVEAQGQSLQ